MAPPLATYRLQFHPGFTFEHARGVADYFGMLGVSHVYASPIFAAKSASTHGYDVIDPGRINPELGGREGFERLRAHLHDLGLGWVQDIVPNHMAFDSANWMLMDILENGRASEYHDYFDIQWEHPYESFRGRVLAPFLGKFYGESLEQGELRLRYTAQGLQVCYHDLCLPIGLDAYPQVFGHRLPQLRRRLGRDHPDTIKYMGVLYAVRNLPPPAEPSERRDQIEFTKRMLWELYQGNETIRAFVDENLQLFNGEPGSPDSFNLLDELLTGQLFRLSFWKVATEEVNYRRFFSINGLISVRQELEHVFQGTHALIISLCREGKFDGLRVDHVDGLYDPGEYLTRLRAAAGDVYLVVEKIFQHDEDLPFSWPIAGATGYGFLNRVNGLFCERKHDRRLEKVYTRFIGRHVQWEPLMWDMKRQMIRRQMTGDVDRLARLLKEISGRDRYARDITLLALRRALIEIMAVFPVYRTYVTAASYGEQDRAFMQRAVQRAREANPAFVLEFDFIERFLLLQFRDGMPEEERASWVRFVMLFQQTTGPLMAKGMEDTALYIYNRLLSLNEVGSNPGRFGTTPIEFHHFQKRRAKYWPHAMNATATHDTKRGEDLRARINVLSELPERWEQRVHTWRRMNQGHKRHRAGLEIPDANDEYFYYQTLIGAYPFTATHDEEFAKRIREYAVKAVREAAVHTAWIKPDEEYEAGYLAFVDATLQQGEHNPFLADFIVFQRDVAAWGIWNSLSQLLLKCTCPGVPDIYQGTELWDLSLVDPDNRRPVDYDTRRAALADIHRREVADLPALLLDLLDRRTDGRIKLFTLYRALHARRSRPRLFTDGDYIPLAVQGRHRNHILAFARLLNGDAALCVVPRRFVGLVSPEVAPLTDAVWGDTRVVLPPELRSHVWYPVYTGGAFPASASLAVGSVLDRFPVALLLSEPAPVDFRAD